MAFLYFFAGVDTVAQSDIVKANLAYAFQGDRWQKRQVVAGPNGKSGVLIARGDIDADRCKMDLARQRWRRIPKLEVYCGRWDEPITPSMLERPTLCESVPVDLADGNVWQVAIARKYSESFDGGVYWDSPLPQELDLDDEGNWRPSRVLPQYARLADLAEQFWKAQTEAFQSADREGDIVRFTFEPIDEFAIAAITANYYAAAVELAMLGAYSLGVRQTIVDATLDKAFLKAMLQKKTDSALDGSASDIGQRQPAAAAS